MNIHAIRVATLEALIWAFPVGKNGRHLTPTPDRYWVPMFHAYRVERRPPMHPIGSMGRWWFQPWTPYHGENADALQPLCGRLNSRSKMPRLSTIGAFAGYNADRYCTDCARIGGGDISFFDTISGKDPWTRLDRFQRQDQPDPISGM